MMSISRCGDLKRAAAVVLLCAATVIELPAQTFTTLATFNGTNGADTLAPLVQGLDGNFYGTTAAGGVNSDGTIFKVTPEGMLTTVHSFDGVDGEQPVSGLVQAINGNFYGTTEFGGAIMYGTVFTITQSGALTTLHNFCSVDAPVCRDGVYPVELIQATSGDFYGTTEETIFKITPTGMLTTLGDVAWVSGLIQAANMDLYGMTTYGGTSSACQSGCGTIFKITPSGTFTTLHSFDYTDGANPSAGLIHALNGDFYGMTTTGGSHTCGEVTYFYGCGTIFRITPAGSLTTLHNFTGGADGSSPYGSLIQATDGNFYGTANMGGTGGCTLNGVVNGCGTIFKITPDGTFTTLHNFCSTGPACTDGALPHAGLLQATNGDFYGTAGGYYGTIFSLSVGLGPFIKTLPTSGQIGSAVTILGTNLTGATSVTFNGVPATFTVASSTEITTTVPTEATTGTVQVVTPTGTLSSNVVFGVR